MAIASAPRDMLSLRLIVEFGISVTAKQKKPDHRARRTNLGRAVPIRYNAPHSRLSIRAVPSRGSGRSQGGGFEVRTTPLSNLLQPPTSHRFSAIRESEVRNHRDIFCRCDWDEIRGRHAVESVLPWFETVSNLKNETMVGIVVAILELTPEWETGFDLTTARLDFTSQQHASRAAVSVVAIRAEPFHRNGMPLQLRRFRMACGTDPLFRHQQLQCSHIALRFGEMADGARNHHRGMYRLASGFAGVAG
jgi:hypothetical protein